MKEINKIQKVLDQKNICQKWLAENINTTSYMLSRYCNNEIQPSIEMLYEIARILEVSPNDLLN